MVPLLVHHAVAAAPVYESVWTCSEVDLVSTNLPAAEVAEVLRAYREESEMRGADADPVSRRLMALRRRSGARSARGCMHTRWSRRRTRAHEAVWAGTCKDKTQTKVRQKSDKFVLDIWTNIRQRSNNLRKAF